jgi:signal transduction histidine kinase
MAMPLSSLRSRVFAAMAVVAVLPIAIALLFVSRQVTRQAEASLTQALREAARIVGHSHRDRLEIAAERATLVADLPKLKAAVATRDPATVEPLARDYRDRVRSDVLLVTDREGRPLASLGGDPHVWAVPGNSTAVAFREDGHRLLEGVRVPILLGAGVPEVLGHLTLAFALDDAFAGRLGVLTGSHVAIVGQGRVFASTLPRAHDAAIAAAAAAPAVSRLEVAGDDLVTDRAALGPGTGDPMVLVLRSRADALRPLRTLRAALTVAAVIAIGASLLLSWALARTVTRPLAALTEAMREIAATGDLARGIGPGRAWDDEDARLVARTFGALTSSVARFQQEAALRERLSALGRLSAVVAHEVRNPLMIIKGSLRSLRREGVAPAEVREAAADIDHEVTRLDRIVGDVLDFARPLRLELAPVDPGALAREAAGAVIQAGDPIEVRFVLEEPAAPIVTDGERLRGVLLNLLANARDSVLAHHTESGGATAEAITVGSRRDGSGRVRLWVEDTGGGVAPTDAPHVFEPFYTTKRSGTGLGLAIARKVIEALGGTIRLDNRPDQGTRIEIDLPERAPSPTPEDP